MSKDDRHPIFGIDFGFDSKSVSVFTTEGRLMEEELVEAAELAKKDFGRLGHEYHSPKCPKITTQGKKACRCGAAPLEAVFEDELETR
jgi:hypothetical protein